jgi:hypothetical protein
MRYTNKQKLFGKRCEMVKQYVDTDGTTLRKAMGHSCEKLTVGVALLVGDDLGKHSPEKVASHFENELAKHKMQSKVFIHLREFYSRVRERQGAFSKPNSRIR